MLRKLSKAIIFIDEIDNFSRLPDANKALKAFVKRITKVKGVKVIGIANSVELFKGDLKQKDEGTQKILFMPYTRQKMSEVLFLMQKAEYDSNHKHNLGLLLCGDGDGARSSSIE